MEVLVIVEIQTSYDYCWAKFPIGNMNPKVCVCVCPKENY